jgi:MFS family permease
MATASSAVSHEREASALQGWVLIAASWLSVIASAVIAPVLPKIAEEFQNVPHVAVKVSLVATLPALFVALLASPFGMLADRVGHRRTLLWGVGVYGFCGTAPYWLKSIEGIVVSRAGVGITEAVIMTCSTAMLGDYFQGDQRERWLAYQTGTATIIAIVMVAIGGALGESTWRLPFTMYAFGFLLVPLVAFFTWEPSHLTAADQESLPAESKKRVFRWSDLGFICLITVFAATAFYVVLVQLGFILTEDGYSSPRLIGMGAALSSLAVPVGAILFRVLRIPVGGKLALSFTFSSLGFFVIAFSHSYTPIVIGAAINGVGSGMVLPTLITWALSKLPPEVRGRGTGAWQGSFFFGQFASPLIILGLIRISGSLSSAVLTYAVACALAAAVALVLLFRDSATSGKGQIEAGQP